MSSERNFETLEAGATYETSVGTTIFVVGKNMRGDGFVGQYSDGELDMWLPDGRRMFDNKSVADLIRKIEPKRVAYVNIYQDSNGAAFGSVKDTREEIDKAAFGNRIACIRVEYTPGQCDS